MGAQERRGVRCVMLASDLDMVNNDFMTVPAVWEELIELSTAVVSAADQAGAVSRVRANDIQLTAVKEHASALQQRVLQLAEADGA